MRKLFILIPAMLLTLGLNAKEIQISSGTVDIISTTIADAGTEDGDVIVLTDNGPYIQANQILFTKSITLRAAEGKQPVIAQQYYSELKNSAQVSIIGIKFDGSLYNSGVGANDHCFRCGDASANKTLYMEDCEITSFKSYIFYIKGGNHLKSLRLKDCTFSSSMRFFYTEGTTTVDLLELDGCELYSFSEKVLSEASAATLSACNITNCYFHDNPNYCVLLENTAEKSLSISNSTFADNNTGLAVNSIVETKNTTGSVLVNHCTFYNCPLNSTSYGTVKFVSPSAVVSNSIFAMPLSIYQRAIHMPDDNVVNNCLTYNYTYDTDGIRPGIAKTACVTGNPYFLNTNPENYDFTVWTTSPAHNAGTDGYDLGDYTRWNTDPATHVATINITAEDDNSLKAAIDAALPGDEIILAAGTYEESESIVLDKEITIKAAEGAHPIVKPVGNFALSNAADITIQNIKFDGTSHTASNFIYANDALNNSLSVEGCEFYNFSKAVIYASNSELIGTCTVNNCQFYDNTHSCVCFKNSAAANLTVTNSTFKNIDGSSVAAGLVESKTATGTLLVDHCTFYNCQVYNTDNGTVKVASPNATVSNCIFAMPTSTSNLRTVYIPSGLAAGTTVTNCIMHRYTHDTNIGVPSREGAVITNCNAIDPLFTDAANGDFSFLYNWGLGVSPAKEAATDGSDLGDPRWYRDNEVIPSSSIASSYNLLSTLAQLKGDVELNASDHIKYKGTSTPGTVKWKLHVDRACMISAVVDREASNISGCQLTLAVKDADGNNVGSLAMTSASYNDNDINLPGTITFPEAGDYTFVLTNSTNGSASALEKITLSYYGGAVQDVAADANTTLNVADAWFTDGFTRADGQVSPGSWKPDGQPLGYVKWNIATSETKFYDLTLNFSSENAHSMAVNIYEDEEASPVATVSESYTSTTGALTISDRINLVGGKNYIVKVTNPTSGSEAKVKSVVFVPVVATSTELPGTLAFSNAILSEKANITDGMLYFNEPGADKDPRGEWAQWEVTTDHAGLFLFTMGVTSTNGQNYKITIMDNSKNVLDFYETSLDSGDKTIQHYFALEEGSYFIQVENTRSYSKGHLTSLVVTEPAGVITINESAESNSAWSAKVDDHNTYDVQIIRTIKAGMYNTFCLPFAVSSSQCKDIFGSDVQIRTLDEATIEEGDFVLNLNFKKASDIYQGTPVLIQTSRDIVNPVFTGVEFTRATPSATTKTNANFTGTFIKSSLEASEDILFLGANNTLYFPTASVEIKGMRGWFVIHGSGGGAAPAIRSARIVENEQVITAIDLVNGQETKTNGQKLIENGQLYILYNGQMYNVQGARVK